MLKGMPQSWVVVNSEENATMLNDLKVKAAECTSTLI
jgi:hypothetical protein